LRSQLEVLDPALVVTLGRFSMQTFLPGARISQAHGTMRPIDPATGARDALAFAMYHPAAAFRQGSLKETMKIDVLGIPDALSTARTRRAEHAPTQAEEPVAAATPDDLTITRDELAELVAVPDPETEETMDDRDQLGMSL
jgi:DNA polymerase